MTIPEMQACLAALYVDERLRRRFHENADSVLQDYRLSERERAALRKIDGAGLDRHASWLEVKRRKRLNRAFPALFAADRQVIEHGFDRYVSLYVQRPNRLIHQDVEDFGQFVEQFLDAATEVPDWLSELARYERMRYFMTHVPTDAAAEPTKPALTRASRPSVCRGVVVEDFRYDVQAIVAAGGRGADIEPASDPCTIVFRAATRDTPPEMMRISDATRVLLHCCDGHRNVEEIIAVAEDELGQVGLGGGILDAIEQLLHHGVLRLQADSVRGESLVHGSDHSDGGSV